MMSMTVCMIADGVSADGSLQIAERSWWRTKASWRDLLLFAAFIAPSLFAEIAPLVLLWNAHLPIWQVPVMMAAAWAASWWVTCVIAMPVLRGREIIVAN